MKNYFKHLFLIAVLSGLYITNYAQQQVEPDPRLFVKFTNAEIEQFQNEEPFKIAWENWLLDNSYTILEIESHKTDGFPYLKEFDCETKTIGEVLSSINPESFNIHEVYYERDYQKSSVYKIGDTGMVISFHSYKTLTKEFNLLRDENK